MPCVLSPWSYCHLCVAPDCNSDITLSLIINTPQLPHSLYAFYYVILHYVRLTQYCAGDKNEKNEMDWACGTYGWGEGVYMVLVGKPEVKIPLGRPRLTWVDNIRTDLQEVGCGYMDWIELAQDRDRWRTLVSTVMNCRVPWNGGKFLTSCKPVSFSRRTLHHGVSK